MPCLQTGDEIIHYALCPCPSPLMCWWWCLMYDNNAFIFTNGKRCFSLNRFIKLNFAITKRTHERAHIHHWSKCLPNLCAMSLAWPERWKEVIASEFVYINPFRHLWDNQLWEIPLVFVYYICQRGQTDSNEDLVKFRLVNAAFVLTCDALNMCEQAKSLYNYVAMKWQRDTIEGKRERCE